jgi:TolB-like protein
MGDHFRKSILFVVVVVLAVVAAKPDGIAVPAFTIAQAYDLKAAEFTDKLASALSRESGYMVYHHSEIASRIDPDILTDIDIENIVTLRRVAVSAGVEYVLAGEIDVSGNQVMVLAKLFKASDTSVSLSISESVTGTAKQFDKLIPGMVAKICAVLPPISSQSAAVTPAQPIRSVKTAAGDSAARVIVPPQGPGAKSDPLR